MGHKKTNGTKFSLRTEIQKWDINFEKGTCNKHKFQIWHKLTREAQHLQTECYSMLQIKQGTNCQSLLKCIDLNIITDTNVLAPFMFQNKARLQTLEHKLRRRAQTNKQCTNLQIGHTLTRRAELLQTKHKYPNK